MKDLCCRDNILILMATLRTELGDGYIFLNNIILRFNYHIFILKSQEKIWNNRRR